MAEEWTGPLAAPPFWLNPQLEVREADEPAKMERPDFVIASLTALVALGCDIEQAIGVVANSVVETGWGQKYRGWNLGGVKANKYNTTYDSRWWRALGHRKSGDSHTCFYKCFDSLEGFYAYWLNAFVPKSGKGRYAKAGQQFWSKDFWFDDLIAAGYKGEVTKQNPENSIESFEEICDLLAVMWVQHKVGTKVDGRWGPKSREAARVWGTARQYQTDGGVTRELLFAVSGMRLDSSRPPPAYTAAPRPQKAAEPPPPPPPPPPPAPPEAPAAPAVPPAPAVKSEPKEEAAEKPASPPATPAPSAPKRSTGSR